MFVSRGPFQVDFNNKIKPNLSNTTLKSKEIVK